MEEYDKYDISKILDNLYLGSYEDAIDFYKLKNLGITHIVNLSYLPNPYPNDFVYLKIDLYDDPLENISQYFNFTIQWIYDAIMNGGKVLVHCRAGISRSSTIILAFLVKLFGITLEKAYNYVKNIRPIIQPNEGFVKQLKDYFK